jgi:hypothetical protein
LRVLTSRRSSHLSGGFSPVGGFHLRRIYRLSNGVITRIENGVGVVPTPKGRNIAQWVRRRRRRREDRQQDRYAGAAIDHIRQRHSGRAAKLIITATAAPVRTILFIVDSSFRSSFDLWSHSWAHELNIGAPRPKGDQPRVGYRESKGGGLHQPIG